MIVRDGVTFAHLSQRDPVTDKASEVIHPGREAHEWVRPRHPRHPRGTTGRHRPAKPGEPAPAATSASTWPESCPGLIEEHRGRPRS